MAERVEYVDEYGKLVTESLRDYSKKAVREQFASLNDFLNRWDSAERKQAIIDELAAEGLLLDPLAEEVGKDLDPFDLICHVAFDQPPLTRRERADKVRKCDIFTKYGGQARAVLEALLDKYQDEGVTNLLLHGIDDPSFVRHDNTLARPYISYTQSDRVNIVLTNPPFGGREEDGIETNFPKHFQTRETADLFLALIVRLLKSGGRAAVVLPDGTLFGEGVKTRLKEHLLEECNLHTIVRLPNSVFKPYASIGTNLLFFEKGTPTKEIWYYEHRVPEGQKAYSMTKPIRIEHLQPCIDWWEKREENEVAWKVGIEQVKARTYNLDFKNPHTVAEDHGDPAELLAKLDQSEAEAAKLRDQLKTILAQALLR